MKVYAEKRLFWFLKDGAELDLSDKANLDMYVQQTISRGRFSDVKKLLRFVPSADFAGSFTRIEKFLPKEVRNFWEESFEYINRSAKKRSSPRLAVCPTRNHLSNQRKFPASRLTV